MNGSRQIFVGNRSTRNPLWHYEINDFNKRRREPSKPNPLVAEFEPRPPYLRAPRSCTAQCLTLSPHSARCTAPGKPTETSSGRKKGRGLTENTYDKGLRIRADVLGQKYVDDAINSADDFNRPFQDLVTEYCWGAVWGREELPRKTRSMLTLAIIGVLNRQHELRTHVRAALTNGVSRDEIREVFMHMAVYAGVPAAVDSFRIAREVFAEQDES